MNYDPAEWTEAAVIQVVESFSPTECGDLLSREPAATDINGKDIAEHDLLFSSAAVALGLLSGPLASLLVPVLLLKSGKRMYQRAYNSLVQRQKLNVDVLDASATSLLLVQGQLPTAAFLVCLVNVADYIRYATMERSRRAITDLLNFQSRTAWVVRAGAKVQVLVEEVQVGETVVVYPGERIQVDGTVISGRAIVDQQTLTGESMPVAKASGDYVYASTVVRDGKIYLQAEHVGDESEVAKIVHLIEEMPIRDTRIQNYAELWADQLVPYSFAGAGVLATFSTVNHAISLLIIDYGTGIRVAAPTAVLSSMVKAVHQGILIKGGRHLEQLAEIDVLVFDKTGTLTTGQPKVVDITSYIRSMTTDDVLRLAAAAEQRLSHPVAQALLQAAETRGLCLPERVMSEYAIGLGVEATIEGMTVHVGNYRFMTEKQIELPQAVQFDLGQIEKKAEAPLCVAVEGEVIGLLALADPIRPEAAQVVRVLAKDGIRQIVMLTGDRVPVAERVANAIGITRYVADLLPHEKVDVVKQLQKEGYKVAVVGDGINDSPALAQADVGIAVSNGTDIAQETADVVLHTGDLWKLPQAITIAREGVALIQQNWQIISIPNTIAMGMVFLGGLGPMGATLISNGSAVVAAVNSLRPLWLDGQNGSAKK